MQKTPIEWCDYSSNPLYVVRKDDGKRGWACTHVSPGCAACYAETLNKRLGTGFPFARKYEGEVDWRLNVKELATWLRHKKPGKCFVADMTDLFHPAIPEAYKLAIVGAAALSPWKIYQVLTKRTVEMAAFVAEHTLADCLAALYTATDDSIQLAKEFPLTGKRAYLAIQQGWPPKNTWWGVSVEDQQWADERIPFLLQIPAAVRFLSCEPLLGPIDLTLVAPHRYGATNALRGYTTDVTDNIGALRIHKHPKHRLHWVILGGESGPEARPCDIAHIRSGVRQCQEAAVAVFVKQWGSLPVMDEDEWRALPRTPVLNARLDKRAPQGTVSILLDDRKGGCPAEWPDDIRVREFPA